MGLDTLLGQGLDPELPANFNPSVKLWEVFGGYVLTFLTLARPGKRNWIPSKSHCTVAEEQGRGLCCKASEGSCLTQVHHRPAHSSAKCQFWGGPTLNWWIAMCMGCVNQKCWAAAILLQIWWQLWLTCNWQRNVSDTLTDRVWTGPSKPFQSWHRHTGPSRKNKPSNYLQSSPGHLCYVTNLKQDLSPLLF